MNETTEIEKVEAPKEKPKKKFKLDWFNGTIYKQSFKSNWKLWAIFTGVMCLFLVISIAVYDPITMGRMMDMMRNVAGEDMMDAMPIGGFGLVGTLAGMFFGMMAVILSMIYILITANSLVASKVDRGSMAYTLSTPIKRKTVAFTQASYLISMISFMFITIAVVGLLTTQIAHGSVFGTAMTADEKALDKQGVTITQVVELKDTNLDEYNRLIGIGAEARNLEEFPEIYAKYIELKTSPAQSGNMDDILGNLPDGMEIDIADMMDRAMSAAAAEIQGKTSLQVMMDMTLLLQHDNAMEAAALEFFKDSPLGLMFPTDEAKTAFFTENIVLTNLAQSQISLDAGYEFDMGKFLLIVLGAFLLAFAVGSISFFASCFFNLSKNSVAVGAGLPIAFYLLYNFSDMSSSISWFKYLSINTLFDPSAIASGGTFWWQFLALATIGVTLFTLAIRVFKKKDLPL